MRIALVLFCGLTAGCTVRVVRTTPVSAPAPAPAVAAQAALIKVGGDYPTAVTLASDECGGSEVRSLPTVVVHEPGDTLLTIFHAGARYSGVVDSRGRFSTTPLTQVFGESSYVVAMSGQFTRTGFTSTVTVDRTDSRFPRGCRYVANWVATLSVGENAIP